LAKRNLLIQAKINIISSADEAETGSAVEQPDRDNQQRSDLI